MKNIKTYLDSAAQAYYDGHPFISDDTFDKLAECISYNKVGAVQHENVKKHYKRLYSLQKYYQDEKVVPLDSNRDTTCTPKLDGAAISLLYIDGHLVQVLQRGDGIEGIDITSKFFERELVPLEISRTEVTQITGEIAAPKTIKNSRNYAAGALNLKDMKEFNTRDIAFFAYGIYPHVHETYYQDMSLLDVLGFRTVYTPDLLDTYPCDGMVFRLNNNREFLEEGYTANHPRGAYAKKERKKEVETKILDVVWQVGKTGKVTPVAILEPIDIDGAIVSRATLNNPGFIEALGISIGDTVGVIRSGDIIPCIVHKVQD